MAHRFPGWPPGSDDDTVASSIHDYLHEEGDFQRLASEFFDDDDSFWSLPDIQQQLQPQRKHQPQQHPQTQTKDSLTVDLFSGRPPGSIAVAHLVSSQVYTSKKYRRRSNTKRCATDLKYAHPTAPDPTGSPTDVYSAHNPTAPDPSRLHKDMYSKHSISHFLGPPVSGSSNITSSSGACDKQSPHWGPTVVKDLYGTVIYSSKIWRQ